MIAGAWLEPLGGADRRARAAHSRSARVFGVVFFFAFLAGAGVPAWWLGYLAMLARPVPANGGIGQPAPLEWYPPGRLVLWAAVLAALVVIVAIPNFGTDAESFRAGIAQRAQHRLARRDRNAADVAIGHAGERPTG